MIYDYLVENYGEGEPIFVSRLPGPSKDHIFYEMKRLADEGKLERVHNGVYFLSYKTVLGTKGRISISKYIEKRFISDGDDVFGYETGRTVASRFGFTSRNPDCFEVCSNRATTKQRKLNVDGNRLIIYRPVAEINKDNASALQFLDLMTNIDSNSEITGKELKDRLDNYVTRINPDFDYVKEYLHLYPVRVYKNIYESGLMKELV